MPEFGALLDGYYRFRAGDYAAQKRRYDNLDHEGQHPPVMVIGCCDSRVDPATIFDTVPGQMFTLRNVANLVPPYSADGQYSEIHAAIEYGVCYLRVKQIIIMGHSRCGGIRSLITRMLDEFDPSHPLDDWTSIAEPVAREVLDDEKLEDLGDKVCACARGTLGLSLENLITYPWVADAVEHTRLVLHGWYFDLSKGELEQLDPETGDFSVLT